MNEKYKKAFVLSYMIIVNSLILLSFILSKTIFLYFEFQNTVSDFDRDRAELYSRNCLFIAIKLLSYNPHYSFEDEALKIDWTNCYIKEIKKINKDGRINVVVGGYSQNINVLYEAELDIGEFETELIGLNHKI